MLKIRFVGDRVYTLAGYTGVVRKVDGELGEYVTVEFDPHGSYTRPYRRIYHTDNLLPAIDAP